MTTKTKSRVDIYQRVTDQIIAYLEQGTAPWRRSWGDYGLAKNYLTNKAYRGINALLLNMSPATIPYFITFKQTNTLGGKIKKGSKAHMVTYFNRMYKDQHGKSLTQQQVQKLPFGSYKSFSFLKYYWVFSTDQIEGIDFEYPNVKLKDNEKIDCCQRLIGGMPNLPYIITSSENKCYYVPSKDTIYMAEMKHFESSEAYYNVLYHEIAHSTGHEKRLSRKGITDAVSFGSKSYSEEELICELGASYLCGITGIDRTDIIENNAAYINGWLSVLKQDKMFVFRVAREAQKAVDYIIAK